MSKHVTTYKELYEGLRKAVDALNFTPSFTVNAEQETSYEILPKLEVLLKNAKGEKK